MKRYIKTNTEMVVHLSDLFDGIQHIVIVDDVTRFNMSSITGSYVGAGIRYMDIELLSMTDKELKSILDYSTLKQIVKLNNTGKFAASRKDKRNYSFSDEQMDIIRSTNDVRVELSKEDRQYMIECLKSCQELDIYPTKKNYMFETIFGMTKSAYREIFDNIDQFYDCNTKSYDLEHLEDNLMVFKPKVDLSIYDPNLKKEIKLPQTEIYVKVDLDETTRINIEKYNIPEGEMPYVVAIVSFHMSDFDKNHDKYEKLYDQILRDRRNANK